MFSEFGLFFQIIPILTLVIFVVVIAGILVTTAKGLARWNKNNHSPRLTVEAELVTKRTQISHHHHGGEHMHTSTDTWYFATFQVASGDRMEFQVSPAEYGMLVQGDRGQLTFQGTRYLSFQRHS